MFTRLRNPTVLLLVTLVAGLLAFGGGLHHDAFGVADGEGIVLGDCWVCLALSAQTIDCESPRLTSLETTAVERATTPGSEPQSRLVTQPHLRGPPVR